MPDRLVINTTPLLSLIASHGNLDLLARLYRQVVVPKEVADEIKAGGASGFGVVEFARAGFLDVRTGLATIPALLSAQLDLGEAAVLQTALVEGFDTVCIDETVGRRIARLSGLKVTGSIGILLRAKREGHPVSIGKSIAQMRVHGIWISREIEASALRLAGE
jgi:predicted nucleic acid-binding protein